MDEDVDGCGPVYASVHRGKYVGDYINRIEGIRHVDGMGCNHFETNGGLRIGHTILHFI